MDRWTVEKDNRIVPPLLLVPSPSLHPSSTSSAPTGLHLSAHRVRHQRQKKKEASSPLWYTFRIIGKYKPARRDFICIPPPPDTSRVAVRRAADRERDRGGRGGDLSLQSEGPELNVPAKLLQNRCWHKSGRFRKLTWPRGFGARMPEDCRK